MLRLVPRQPRTGLWHSLLTPHQSVRSGLDTVLDSFDVDTSRFCFGIVGPVVIGEYPQSPHRVEQGIVHVALVPEY